MGTARTTFLVDPDGRIAKVWPKVKPEATPARSWPPWTSSRPSLADRPVTVPPGNGMRLRSWGRRAKPRPQAYAPLTRPARTFLHGRRVSEPPPARHMTGPPEPPRDHDWRPARFMVIAGHPDDADFGPAGTAARCIDADPSAGLCVARRATRVARTRTPIRSSWRRCARPSSAPRRPWSATRRELPPPAGRRARERPPVAGASSARSGRSGRTRSSPPTRRPCSIAAAA